jgi:hypothetical protein
MAYGPCDGKYLLRESCAKVRILNGAAPQG